jgi:Tfp pilus assembly protein PilN
VATTVVHVDNVWLTSLNRSGNSIDIQGESASINSVANFITQLKRSGYFDNVEIKAAQEDDIVPSVETFNFSMSASIATPPAGTAKPQPTGATQAAPAPGRGGRS